MMDKAFFLVGAAEIKIEKSIACSLCEGQPPLSVRI